MEATRRERVPLGAAERVVGEVGGQSRLDAVLSNELW